MLFDKCAASLLGDLVIISHSITVRRRRNFTEYCSLDTFIPDNSLEASLILNIELFPSTACACNIVLEILKIVMYIKNPTTLNVKVKLFVVCNSLCYLSTDCMCI